MELGLSLGHETVRPKPFSSFLEKSQKLDLGFCMAVGSSSKDHSDNNGRISKEIGVSEHASSSDPPVQLDLLPSSNKFSLPWLNEKLTRASESNKRANEADQELGADFSSPNSSTVSSFQMDFSMFRSARGKRDFEGLTANNNNRESSEADNNRGTSNSRGSDDEDQNGMARKKLRLTKDQSAFLEESFKEHNTLNPKQKLALAKQLNLRPRQVEVWFQNRRARTKLKQTEVDCEYLKRCCETLTDENKRLAKELHELKALKASQPFYRQLPATTLTMCPSCERVAPTTTTAAIGGSAAHAATTGGASTANKRSKLF